MADIRTTALLDSFEYSENPMSNGGKWEKGWNGWANMDTNGAEAGMASAGSSVFFWTPETFSGDMEVWGQSAGVADLSEGWRLAMLSGPGASVSTITGYILLVNNAIGGLATWAIRKYPGGGTGFSNIGGASGQPRIDTGSYALFRRNGDDLEAYISTDGGANWTLIASVTDTDFTTDLNIGIGLDSDDGTGEAWAGVGGGGSNTTIVPVPQYIRRTHRRGASQWRP